MSYLLILEQQKRDVKWLIEVRNTPNIEKISMLTKKCPCCVARIQQAYYFLNDQELLAYQADLQERFLALITTVNINSAL